MTETPALPPEPAPAVPPVPPVPPVAPAAGRNAPWLGIVALIALTALGVTGWQAYSNRQDIDGLRQELAKRLADVDAHTKAGRIAGEQLRESTREASVKIGVLEGKLAESQNQQIALESLYQELSRNRDEWAFAEIEQTLLVASQQLQLAGNVRAALIALQAADTRLQHMNRPQLLALRKAISEDIARLKAAPFVDTVGLSVRIDTLIAAVDDLPLAAETRPSAATIVGQTSVAESAVDGPAWSRFLREVWSDLRQLVRVQRIETADVPLLAPSQAFFVRENLKLRLLAARMALLTRDQSTFHGDVKAAREMFVRYFDVRDKAVLSVATALAGLQTSEVNIELPDISGTLSALRAVSEAGAPGK